MILSVFLQRRGIHKDNFLFELFKDQDLVATIENDARYTTKANLNDDVYEFPLSIKKIKRRDFNFKYKKTGKKEFALGFKIYKNKEVVAEYYREAAIVNEKGFFKKKIAFDVFTYNERTYLIFRVGLPKGSSHYYCMIDAITGDTVVILERLGLNKENMRARLYFEDENTIELAMMLVSNEMAVNICTNIEGQIVDPSSGKYISLRKEETEFLDLNFIKRIASGIS